MQRQFVYTFTRLAALLLTIGIGAFVYKRVYWVPELREQGPMLYNLLEYQWHNDVLYIGESSNIWTGPDDTDKRNISDMVNDSLEGFRMSGLQQSAYHAGMYASVVEWIDPGARVKHLVVSMNLRSFGKPWIYSGKEASLQRTRCFYGNRHPLVNRLSAVLGFYHNPSEKTQETLMLRAFESDTLRAPFPLTFNTIKDWCAQEKFPMPGGGEDFPKRELADHYIKAYAFQIDPLTNPRIRDFDHIVDVCKQKGIQLYFNLLPENMDYADSLVGPQLTYFMKFNRDLLMARYAKKGVVCIDQLELVPGVNFGEKSWTTEHYLQKGRMAVAMQVRDTLQRYMKTRLRK